MNANDLSALLWRERALLERLLLKLETERFFLREGSLHWLGHSTEELRDVLGRLRLEELARSVEVSLLAREWSAPDSVTLGGLVAHAPTSVWAEILGAHLTAMSVQARRVMALGQINEELLEKAALQAREEPAKLSTDTHGISVIPHPDADTDADDLDLMLRDDTIRAAQVITGQVLPGTLQEFLRIPKTP
ncbi:flagellar export chaperone FlgN [Arthrobacter liuii]|uniref:DUF222 domain-containing protein n=1 Tax=Arthrobacter liuii TaxID=1476996 RepID=A0ABQ2AYM7_9MICC|nr:flagellar protein FlgN [Arthrobacter liuii]GGH99268.1 hypothetical protein GCM10007170_33710 [Arthrobacter liuii]